MNKTIHILACTVTAVIALAACAAPESLQYLEEANAQQASLSFTGRTVYLRAIKTQLSTPRAAIGLLYPGSHCILKGDVIWDDTLFREISYQLPKIFRREARRAHYQVPSDSNKTIDMQDGESMHSGYAEVDMQVEEVSAGLCTQEEGTSGSAHVKVFWQVYAAGTSTPLYETVTQGSYDAPIMEKRSAADFFSIAFSEASRKLLADRGFRKAILQGDP